MIQTKVCENCKKEFKRKENSKDYHWLIKRFCSDKCQSSFKDTPGICLECGKDFLRRKRNKKIKFCSNKCGSVYSSRQKSILNSSIVICCNCGKEYRMSNSHIKRKKDKGHNFYCSQKCETEKRTENNCVCKTCSKEFHRTPYHIKNGFNQYCSHKCQSLGYKTGNYRNCKKCNKEFYVSKIQIRRNKQYCSWNCLHSESEILSLPCYNCGKEIKRYKSRLRKYNFCDSRCYNQKQEFGFGIVTKSKSGKSYPSRIESIFSDVLEFLNIEFKSQVFIKEDRKWTCDFTVEIDNKVYWIEIDGMGDSRRKPYFNKNGNPVHEKIKYYIENDYDLFVLSNKDFVGDLKNMLFELDIDMEDDELEEITKELWKY